MKVIERPEVPIKEVQMIGADKVMRQLAIGSADQTPLSSVRVFTVEPGGHTPHHTHPFEHINYVISGSGELVTDEGPVKLERDKFLLVLPNERHQFRNPIENREALVFICIVPKEYE